MTTIDGHADISLSLALEFEGRAINAGLTAEEYLREIMRVASKRDVATTPKQREILRYLSQGLTDPEVAKIVGTSRGYVVNVRTRFKLPPRTTPETRAKLEDTMVLYHRGFSDSEIAKRLNLHRTAVAYRRRQQGLPPNQKSC